jgi:DNA-binding transcriptional LysR family regulator
MDLRHLRAFAAVADSRSFSKAARQLKVAQPPLSRHIRQLEDELGVKLFVRSTIGVELTREGAVLLEKARGVLAEASGFLELAGRAKSGAAHALRIGMARGLCEVVNRVRVHMIGRHPGVSIEGTDIASSSQYAALRRRTIDIGVMRHVDVDAAVESQPLFAERFVAILSEHHPLARKKSIKLKQLADQPLLIHDREWAALAHDKILGLYAAAGVTPAIVTLHAEPGDQASMLAVASGEGVSLALRSAISRSYVPVGGVAVVPLDEPGAELQVQVTWRKGESSRTVHQFVQSARDVFASQGSCATRL